MEPKNKTPTTQEENAIKMAIISLRMEMREHAKYKTLDPRKELNYIYSQLGLILNL